jgi:hypothetical protein
MILLGSAFSPAFAEVILLTDVLVLIVVLATAFYDQIASACVKALHHASATLAFVAARIGARHR